MKIIALGQCGIKSHIHLPEESSTAMIDGAVDSKKLKDYIYSLYKRNLITFERYVHKLGLIESDDEIETNEVCE